MRKNLIIVVNFIIFYNCSNKPKNAYKKLNEKQKMEIQNVNLLSKEVGLNKLKANCYSCHNPHSNSHDNMLAPPLAGIKHKYKELYPSQELFITQMSEFIENPSKENAVMKGPVRRFGLMPKTVLSKREIQELVKYIYNNKLEYPEWFSKHFEEQHDEKWEESKGN